MTKSLWVKCDCGNEHGPVSVFPLRCSCGQRHDVANGSERTPRFIQRHVVFPEWQADRIMICATCPLRKGTRCGVLAKRGKRGVLMHHRGIPRRAASCPDGRWDLIKAPVVTRSLRPMQDDAVVLLSDDRQHGELENVPERFRDKLDDDCMVITAADQRFIRGTYFMLWTMLRSNDVRARLYVDDVPRDDPHVQQIESWGVEVKEMPHDVGREVFFQQTWNKPSTILDALQDSERVLWLDADTSVASTLREAFDIIAGQVFSPDHADNNTNNQNSQELWDFLGEPKRKWDGPKAPCAGVVGVSRRDIDAVVQPWRDRCLKVIADGRYAAPMLNHEVRSPLMYHDQGVFQDLMADNPVDGFKWNNFQCARTGTIRQIMDETYNHPVGVILHFGGAVKPWFEWPEQLHWPDPRSYRKSPLTSLSQ